MIVCLFKSKEQKRVKDIFRMVAQMNKCIVVEGHDRCSRRGRGQGEGWKSRNVFIYHHKLMAQFFPVGRDITQTHVFLPTGTCVTNWRRILHSGHYIYSAFQEASMACPGNSNRKTCLQQFFFSLNLLLLSERCVWLWYSLTTLQLPRAIVCEALEFARFCRHFCISAVLQGLKLAWPRWGSK